MSLRIHALFHTDYADLSFIKQWARAHNHPITVSRSYDNDNLPTLDSFDWLIVMGGPMSVNDEQDYPWLVDEKRFMKRVIETGTPTLGICLGAQLIADSMGAEVFPNIVKEIGWLPIQAVKSASTDVFRFPGEIEVFHWHGETFSLPPAAVRIAESKGCENQAFQLGNTIIGLQFHLETTPSSAQAIVANCRDELVEGEYIQAEKDILSAPHERYSSINGMMSNILEYLHKNNG